MTSKGIYTVEYLGKDEMGYGYFCRDMVYAKSKEQALEKFHKKHPDYNKEVDIVDWIFADY